MGWEHDRHTPPARYYPVLIRLLGQEPWPAPRSQGERLRAERLRRGLSREQFAAVLVVDASSVAVWEKGKDPMHQLAKKKVAALLEGRARPTNRKRPGKRSAGQAF
jgi:ribosome-binding protein aMBF1 (putative translation factor)